LRKLIPELIPVSSLSTFESCGSSITIQRISTSFPVPDRSFISSVVSNHPAAFFWSQSVSIITELSAERTQSVSSLDLELCAETCCTTSSVLENR